MKQVFTIFVLFFVSLTTIAQIKFPFDIDLLSNGEINELISYNSEINLDSTWKRNLIFQSYSMDNYAISNWSFKTLKNDSFAIKIQKNKFLYQALYSVVFGLDEQYQSMKIIKRKNDNLSYNLTENNETISLIDAIRVSTLNQSKSIQGSFGTITNLVNDTSFISIEIKARDLDQIFNAEVVIITDGFSEQNNLVFGKAIHEQDTFTISSVKVKKKKKKNCEGIEIAKGNKPVAAIQISGFKVIGDLKLKLHSLVDKHLNATDKILIYSLIPLIGYYYLEK